MRIHAVGFIVVFSGFVEAALAVQAIGRTCQSVGAGGIVGGAVVGHFHEVLECLVVALLFEPCVTEIVVGLKAVGVGSGGCRKEIEITGCGFVVVLEIVVAVGCPQPALAAHLGIAFCDSRSVVEIAQRFLGIAGLIGSCAEHQQGALLGADHLVRRPAYFFEHTQGVVIVAVGHVAGHETFAHVGGEVRFRIFFDEVFEHSH